MTTDVRTNDHAIVDRLVAATEEAVQDMRLAMRVPRFTGRLSASLAFPVALDADGDLDVAMTSSLPYARAADRGANAGPRPGPHMAGAHFVGPALEGLPDRVAEHFRGGS